MSKIVLDREVEEKIKKVADKNGIGLNQLLNIYLSDFSEKRFFEGKKGKIEDFFVENFSDEDNQKIEGLSNFKLFKESVSGM